jgi:cell division protein FtsL
MCGNRIEHVSGIVDYVSLSFSDKIKALEELVFQQSETIEQASYQIKKLNEEARLLKKEDQSNYGEGA